MMTPKRLLPALALFVLPSIGCVGAAPVDEPAPVPAAAAPANAAGTPSQGLPHGSGTTSNSVGSTDDGAGANMLGGCIPGPTGDGTGGDDGIPCPPPQHPQAPPVQGF